MKKSKWKTYAAWVLLTEAVGALAGWLTRDGVKLYNLNAIKPPLSPPPAVFPVAWVILYALMGIGAARVYLSDFSQERRTALTVYGVQLAFNFMWSIIFFDLRAYLFALVWIIVLWALIVRMTVLFWKCDKPAGWMQIPYVLWVLFAAYLNYGVWRLN